MQHEGSYYEFLHVLLKWNLHRFWRNEVQMQADKLVT